MAAAQKKTATGVARRIASKTMHFGQEEEDGQPAGVVVSFPELPYPTQTFAQAEELDAYRRAIQQEAAKNIKANIVAVGEEYPTYKANHFFDFYSKGYKHFNGSMYSLQKPCFLLVHAPIRHIVFASKFGHRDGGDQTVLIEHPELLPTLTLLAKNANEQLFGQWAQSDRTPEVKAFFKFADGMKLYNENDQQITTKFDWKATPCRADFLLRYYGVYDYTGKGGEKVMKLVMKVEQAKIMVIHDAAQLQGKQLTFDICML
jgi:hypothetical protein